MHGKTSRITLTAVFIALTLLLGMTPLGLIPLGVINLTILWLPVITGTLFMGLKTGIGLGLCFGLASALSAFGLSLVPASALARALIARSPILAILMCFVPRLLVPMTTWLAYKGLGGEERFPLSAAGAAVTGTLTNTVFYLGLMLLFYTVTGLDNMAVKAVIGGTGLLGGGCEAVAAAILVPPILRALGRLKRQ